jgi:NTE family protein
MGVLFDAMFLDHLATDFEHLERLNQRLEDGHIVQPGVQGSGIRRLGTLLISPSVHLSDLAQQHQHDMPYMIQYFVSSLGRDAASCADLMSYLLFTSKYTRDLIELGYHDAGERIDEIEDFLYSSRDGDAEDLVDTETGSRNAARAVSGAKRAGSAARSRG